MILGLESERLEVVKERSPRGGYVRVVVHHNPDWYRAFCGRHQRARPRWRKLKTYIKRRETLAALWRIAKGARLGCYVERLLPVVEDYAAARRAEERYEASRPSIERRYRSPA